MIRERCGCGAEFETNEAEAVELWYSWRDMHTCPEPVIDGPSGGLSQAEVAPDYTIPELHIGFRA